MLERTVCIYPNCLTGARDGSRYCEKHKMEVEKWKEKAINKLKKKNDSYENPQKEDKSDKSVGIGRQRIQ